MPTIYLIRHGIATERGTYRNDGDRPLTDAGIDKTKRVANRLLELDVTFDLILSSPLVRATQTAAILHAAKLSSSVALSEDLAPDGDMHTWLAWVKQWEQQGGKTLAVVGHQPDLGNWAEMLVWGEVRARIVVKKAGIIGVECPDMDSPIGTGELFWLTPPRFFL